VLVGGWSILRPKQCVSDGTRVCLNGTTDMFAIEDKAKIVIQVESQAYGKALLELFNAKHPDQTGALSFVVTQKKGDPLPDISYISQNEAAVRYTSLMQIDATLRDLWKNNLQWDKSGELNNDGLRFIPMAGDGFSFIYDATVLKRLGVDLKDANKDGLPDAIDTVEKTAAIAKKYLAEDKNRSYTSIFPIQFNEVLSFYPLLTIDGWEMFPDHIATQPGFETAGFLNALKHIADLGSASLVKTSKIKTESLVWQFDQVLTGKEFLFSMASDWMFVEAFETRTKHDVRRARFPSMDGYIPSPLLNVEGFVVNTDKYPSAISEVLRLIRSPEGLALFAKSSDEAILADPSILNTLTFDNEKQKDLALAYVHSISTPLAALEGNPAVLGFSMYRQITILPVLKQVFTGEISPVEAQKAIIAAAEEWIDANHGYPSEATKK
jgi:arabinogalactan oligomer / maltooligosaccharide transport system substrate-binding protein